VASGIEIVGAVASGATAIGVMVAAWQLALTKGQAATQFEDNLNVQYREIIRRVPIEALLGGTLGEAEQQESLADFFHYFDLSNEQAFLRRQGRIRKRTWDDWREGITQNLSKPAFAAAWQEITKRSPAFSDLKVLVPAAKHLASAGAAAQTPLRAAKSP
jgi:hypothetical protein